MIEIVCATRLDESAFHARSLLGRSLQRLKFDLRLIPRIAYSNARGLPEIYNERIDDAAAPAGNLLAFVHDDVWIDDFLFGDRLQSAAATYDLIGVAGNRRRLPGQPGWVFANDRWTIDRDHLSGAIAHGEPGAGPVSYYGPAPASCELLDGVLLVARRSTLRDNGVRFDPGFAFHFYDLDLCRAARGRGLKVGTWPICITHASPGTYDSPLWREARRRYREKWGD